MGSANETGPLPGPIGREIFISPARILMFAIFLAGYQRFQFQNFPRASRCKPPPCLWSKSSASENGAVRFNWVRRRNCHSPCETATSAAPKLGFSSHLSVVKGYTPA